MTTTKDNRILGEVFAEVGKAHGFDNVEAKYAAMRDFRYKWERTYTWVKFTISDYLSFADRDTLTEFAERVFYRINGDIRGYGTLMRDYVRSPEFVRKAQPIYIKRSKGFDKSPVPEGDRLFKAINRLDKLNILPNMMDVRFYWTNERMIRKAGYYSPLLKVIAIPSILNDERVPDYVLEYLVLHYMTEIEVQRGHFGEVDYDTDYDVEVSEASHDGIKGPALTWLKAMNMRV